MIEPGRPGSPFRQGLVTNLLNPKLAVFFTTLLPQFISEGDPVFAKSMLLAGVFVAIGMTWLVVYAYAVGTVARSARFRRAVETISGVVRDSARRAARRRPQLSRVQAPRVQVPGTENDSRTS